MFPGSWNSFWREEVPAEPVAAGAEPPGKGEVRGVPSSCADRGPCPLSAGRQMALRLEEPRFRHQQQSLLRLVLIEDD